MKLSEHDQTILKNMEKEFEKLTGKKATHVFVDTNETLKIKHCWDGGNKKTCDCPDCGATLA
ncbi:MAG: hypothetical protein COB35_04845 [Gammaproteobacteria bacterium]|nr:MAG: hypothetical protein COB35_04845 [Gammaproteobacteria bacterium]